MSEKWAYDIAGTGTFESNILAAHALYRRVVKEGRGAVSTVPGGEQLLKLLWNSMYDQVGKRHLGHHLDGLVLYLLPYCCSHQHVNGWIAEFGLPHLCMVSSVSRWYLSVLAVLSCSELSV